MTGRPSPAPAGPARPGADTVFFLSDYGVRDEFVGVVHAVLRRRAPHVQVIDLTHEVPPFGVRFGAWLLARSVPHLGPGVVLGIVDPGVGGPRRPVALQVASAAGPGLLVGPDNGLLVPAADVLGGVAGAVVLSSPGDVAPPGDVAEPQGELSVTFDGRDLFAPVAASWCRGAALAELGSPIDPAHLVRLPEPVDEAGRLSDGRRFRRAEVTWVDRFGNVQVAARADSVPAQAVFGVRVHRSGVWEDRPGAGGPVPAPLDITGGVRRVRTFVDLEPGELGLLVDANAHLALVAREGSAALLLDAGPGDLVELVW